MIDRKLRTYMYIKPYQRSQPHEASPPAVHPRRIADTPSPSPRQPNTAHHTPPRQVHPRSTSPRFIYPSIILLNKTTPPRFEPSPAERRNPSHHTNTPRARFFYSIYLYNPATHEANAPRNTIKTPRTATKTNAPQLYPHTLLFFNPCASFFIPLFYFFYHVNLNPAKRFFYFMLALCFIYVIMVSSKLI